MGLGLFLMVLGAILAFAVEDHVDNLNLRVMGLIIMIAGAAVVAHYRGRVERERVITRREGGDGPETEEVVRERDADHHTGHESSY
ncbi:MAG: hypothetical protein HOQ22_01640 [Nocardioidaceae bacterium]|nr:hypothetical protein [Nocardioidaceae bacterium]NUS49728.1 hypothetical protein [Nocardioidaceae bacterium]